MNQDSQVVFNSSLHREVVVIYFIDGDSLLEWLNIGDWQRKDAEEKILDATADFINMFLKNSGLQDEQVLPKVYRERKNDMHVLNVSSVSLVQANKYNGVIENIFNQVLSVLPQTTLEDLNDWNAQKVATIYDNHCAQLLKNKIHDKIDVPTSTTEDFNAYAKL